MHLMGTLRPVRSLLVFVCLALGGASALFVSAEQAAPPQAPAAATPAAVVEATDPATAPLTAKIPVDRRITTGVLPNGLKYYVRANQRPENRAELRLVVNAGSVLEDDDQQGLAHFVEHMAFNGTKNFPKLNIVAFMESIGMRFGPSVNAFTSFDETVYQLQIPTDKREVVERALLILDDWARNVTFDPVEVDKERGVIIEEWRLRRGAGARLQEKQFPVLLANSRYASRMPIGKTEVLQTFSHDRLKKFYTDWYRPDLMAVIAVGDFVPAEMEAMIRARFSEIPRAASPKPRPVYNVPARAGTSYAIAADPELAGTQVNVYHTAPAQDESTVGSYRDRIVLGLFTGMLNLRFAEIARKPDAPFLSAGAGHGALVRTTEAKMLSASVRPNEVERGLSAVFEEAERVARFGFTQTELDRQKINMLRAVERAALEVETHQSGALADEYGRNFLTTEPCPGIAYEHALYQRFLPGITLAEMNDLAKNWVPDRDRVVVVSAPERAGSTLPTQAALAAVMSGVAGKTLTAYEDRTAGQPLLAAAPKPGTILSTAEKPSIGVTEWKLSNGVTVILKPTTFRQDEVVFRAFSPGGFQLASDEDFIPASRASAFVASGGLGQLSTIDLRRVTTGKVASADPAIQANEEVLAGGGSTKDLETLFQLIYLRFTQPRADPEIFKTLVDQTRIQLTNQMATPGFAFSQALNEALTQGHPRARMLTLGDLDLMNLDKSMAFYRDRFADASDFTFVFAGSFDLPTLRPFVEQYLASLPSLGRKETARDFGIKPAPGITKRRVERGLEPKADSVIVFSGPMQYNPTTRAVLRAMSMVLEGRLRNSMREEMGGTYSVSASANYGDKPSPRYTLQIAFGSDPAKTDALVARVFQEIETLKANGATANELGDVKEIMVRDYETNMKTNGFLVSNLAGRLSSGESIEDLFSLEAMYRSISLADVQAAAKQYLDTENYVQVQLFPQPK
jgi:zinc protease